MNSFSSDDFIELPFPSPWMEDLRVELLSIHRADTMCLFCIFCWEAYLSETSSGLRVYVYLEFGFIII